MKQTKHTILALALALSATTSIGFAQEGDNPEKKENPDRPERRPERPDRPDRPRGGGPLIMALDADKNGEISAEEIAGAPAALKTLDKNGDGKLTMEELRPEGGRPGGEPGGGSGGGGFTAEAMVERMMQADTNGDGKVSKEEAPERMQRAFERGDTNGDDALDEAELKVLAAEIAKRFGGGGQQRPGQGGGDRRRGGKDGDPAQPDKPKRPDFEE